MKKTILNRDQALRLAIWLENQRPRLVLGAQNRTDIAQQATTALGFQVTGPHIVSMGKTSTLNWLNDLICRRPATKAAAEMPTAIPAAILHLAKAMGFNFPPEIQADLTRLAGATI